MPTNRTRRSRVSRGATAAMSLADYDLALLDTYFARQMEMDDALAAIFGTEAAGRQFYAAHRATFNTMLCDANSGEPDARHFHRPGRRHETWWRYESPERRDHRETELEQLIRLGVLSEAEQTLVEKESEE